MRLSLIFDHRFKRDADGIVFSPKRYDARFFEERYLTVFDSVHILARVDEEEAERTVAPTEAERVTLIPLPMWAGPVAAAVRARRIRDFIRLHLDPNGATLLVTPGVASSSIASYLWETDWPYGVEVIGDPAAALSRGAYVHPARVAIRWHLTQQLGRLCARAAVASYVTSSALQSAYPGGQDTAVFGVSDVVLYDSSLVKSPKVYTVALKSPTIAFVGTLEAMYKGVDILLLAIRECVDRGLVPRVLVVGGGRHLQEMKTESTRLGITDSVTFLGNLPAGTAVNEVLRQSDLFVLPSRQEGLPRAMVEAMAEALPCIGSRVGGIPELLPDECLVKVGDSRALANLIIELCSSPGRLTRYSAQNLERARTYTDRELQPKRIEFCRTLKEKTQQWIDTRR